MDKTITNTVANIISVNLLGIAEKVEKNIRDIASPEQVLEIATLFHEDKINNKGVQAILETLATDSSLSVADIVTKQGLAQVSDDTALQAFVDIVIQNNPDVVAQFKDGDDKVVGFLIGQCMKESKGQGNPKRLRELLLQSLAQ